jgi:hypothetical protein
MPLSVSNSTGLGIPAGTFSNDGLAVIASSSFTPQPGTVYADQMTLDEVMAP